ncbi:restriction endonuclease subunit S [Cohnella cellulosilytica]|uniref:restriction endonuclease subunit S n=1 Tax=Cohnella cellulosilytica TaxID=986710 RepID=UPI00361559EF
MKCIEDEIPFEVPESWAWARLGSLAILISDGDHQPPPQSKDGVPFLVISDITAGRICFENVRFVEKTYYDNLAWSRKPQQGDVLFTVTGSYGIPVNVKIEEKFCFQRHIALIRPCIIKSDFLSRFLESSFIKHQCDERATGIAQKTVGLESLRRFLFPLPPFKEQRQIIEIIESVCKQISIIEVEKYNLAALIARAKSKILDHAIRGKLIPQDPSDEPASELLERIRDEREELIKAGKIKRDKKESYIFRGDDNSYYEDKKKIQDLIPFQIPETWAWTRLRNLCLINPRNVVEENVMASFVPMTLINDGYSNAFTYLPRAWTEIKTGFTHFQDNDVGVAKITPCFENRKSVVFSELLNGIGAGTTELHIVRPINIENVLPYYVLWLFKSKHFITNGTKAFSGAVGQQRIGKEYVSDILFPLPPVAEQKRIVAAIKAAFEPLDNIAATFM